MDTVANLKTNMCVQPKFTDHQLFDYCHTWKMLVLCKALYRNFVTFIHAVSSIGPHVHFA